MRPGTQNSRRRRRQIMRLFNAKRLMIFAVGILAFVGAAQAADISGAGATFPYPIYSKWADAYKKETGVGLNYQSIGSGGGIKQIKAKTVTFGATDMPLEAKDLQESGLVQFPMIIGGVVPVVNLKGVQGGQMVLDGATVAPIYRSDGSGTNFLFSTYLSSSYPKFKETIGANTSVQWPVGIGAKGNEGVANMTAQTDGAIGYVEYAFAKQNKMAYTNLINSAGKKVTPDAESFQAAAASADWAHAPGYHLILTNQPGDKSWPITGASFILVYGSPPDPAATGAALKFFDWAFKNGAKMAADLDYVPLPDSLVSQVRNTWKTQIKGVPAI